MISLILKGYKVAITGIYFALFGVGALCLSLFVFPLISYFHPDPVAREKQVQRIIQKAFALFSFAMKYSGVIRFHITGAEKLREDKACLIVANHPSLIDYILIAAHLPQCDCLVKAALWENRFLKGIVRAAGYIPNNNPEDVLIRCAEKFKQGNVLLIFPEGTRTSLSKPPELQRGAAQIAVRSAVDIRVIHISMTPRFLTKEQRWFHVPDIRPFFHLEVKGRIAISDFLNDDLPLSMATRRLNRALTTELFPNS